MKIVFSLLVYQIPEIVYTKKISSAAGSLPFGLEQKDYYEIASFGNTLDANASTAKNKFTELIVIIHLLLFRQLIIWDYGMK